MGDDIQFELISENKIKMHGFNFDWCRFGLEPKDKSIQFVDPSGGPMISIGTDMNLYFDGRLKKEARVAEIVSTESGDVILIV